MEFRLSRLRRRASRRDQAVAAIRERRPPRRFLAPLGVAVAVVAVLAVVARRRLWQAVGLAARAVEEVADVVEDAAEDLGDAARERAGGED